MPSFKFFPSGIQVVDQQLMIADKRTINIFGRLLLYSAGVATPPPLYYVFFRFFNEK